jgi:hypothetical protein
MFAFCVERFHMSESMTAKRIWAARTARRFPVILPMVARGDLHLSAIMKLAKHLTEDNHRGLLLRARHKSSREIDLLVAELDPRPDVPSRIRALPRPTGSVVRSQAKPTDACMSQGPEQAMASCAPAAPNVAAAPNASSVPTVPTVPTAPRPHGQVVALAPRRYKIEITVDQQTHDKLRMLQDLLGHQLRDADPAIIVSRAIDWLLDDTLKKKAAITDQPRLGDRSSGGCSDQRTRAIPAAIRREVWRRDGGRCIRRNSCAVSVSIRESQRTRCRSTVYFFTKSANADS